MSTTLVASSEHQGWPDRLHSGVLYLAMLETANWTLFGLRGRVGLPIRTSALETRRWVAIGERLSLEGHILPSADVAGRIRVVARDGAGLEVATLERDYELPDRRTFLMRVGYAVTPPELEGLLPE